MVVLLRYGSLTDFSNIRLGWTDITKRTGIHPQTCHHMIYAFHKRGNSVKRAYGGGRQRRELPDDV